MMPRGSLVTTVNVSISAIAKGSKALASMGAACRPPCRCALTLT